MAPRINVNIPPITRGILASLIAFSLFNAWARYRSWAPERSANLGSRQYYAPYLTIVPGLSLRYPWTFVTATLAEQNPVGLIVTGATLFYGGRYLERAWSSREYTKFVVLVSLLPNVLSFLVYYTLFLLTKHQGLASTSINGGIAIQAAFLVSFKQLVPEHTVQALNGLIRTRVKHLPAIFLVANTISGLAFGTDTAMLLAWLGFFTSWSYLRFYRVSPALALASTGSEAHSSSSSSYAADDFLRGDASDTFSFAAFFPDIAQPAVAVLSDTVYNALVSIRVCAPFSAADVEAGNDQASARGAGGMLPSLMNNHHGRGGAGKREEAERRRALALRQLDQRLHAVTATTSTMRAPAQQGIQGQGLGLQDADREPLGDTTYKPEHGSGLSRGQAGEA